MKHEPTTPIPPAHPDYKPAPTQRVRIGKRECVEMDASAYVGLMATAEFFSKGRKL
jgi:hypothetical protein